jgi:hypothetical protein
MAGTLFFFFFKQIFALILEVCFVKMLCLGMDKVRSAQRQQKTVAKHLNSGAEQSWIQILSSLLGNQTAFDKSYVNSLGFSFFYHNMRLTLFSPHSMDVRIEFIYNFTLGAF